MGELVVAPPGATVGKSGEQAILVTHPAGSPVLKITPLNGSLQLHEMRISFGTAQDGGEVCIEEVGGEPDPQGEFDRHVASRAGEFQAWLNRYQSLYPHAEQDALTEAAYTFWSFQAGPTGTLRRRAVYMSKNWMTGIWSWDNCFNAIALADIDPELAWDQFCFFFDWQQEDGRFPDLITATSADWGMTKPPIYGCTLSKLRQRHAFFNDPARLREVYEPMVRQIRFWLETRDGDGDGLPQYHNGCDSGWDNGTAFLDNVPCASPDLAALGEEGRFLTAHGVATESIISPLYEQDGYWRGPIWGPSTVMAVEACLACGGPHLARDIARRFCSMGPKFGFAENHDARTGQGLRDPAYSWTAAAWLILNRASHRSLS